MNGDRIHPDQRVNPYGHSHWQAKLAALLFAAAALIACWALQLPGDWLASFYR